MADRKILFRSNGGFNEASTTADRISSAGVVSGAADIVLSRNGSATDRITIGSGSTTIDNPFVTTSSATRAAIRLGSFAGDPSSLSNGDLWYNSATGKFRAYQGGAAADVIGGGSGSGDAVSKSVSQASHGLAVKDVIRHNGTSWVKAKADAPGTLGIGVVTAVADADAFTVTLAGYATMTSHGLTAGEYYFCSTATSGLLTATEPTSGYSNPLLFVLDANTAIVLPWRPSAIASASSGVFQARLQRDSATAISLQRYAGQYVEVGGEMVDVGASGLSCATSDNTINGTGGDSGTGPSASSTYQVYVSNSSASFAPLDLRLSGQSPSLVGGVKYLGTSGNALNWRFVGWVYLDGSTQFSDDTTNRLVVNYYNRARKTLVINPGYSNGNTSSSYTRSGNWTAANGGTNASGSFISNGEDAADFVLSAAMSTPDGVTGLAGIGIDTTTDPLVTTHSQGSSSTNDISSHVATSRTVHAEGRHTVSLCVAATGGTATYYSDTVRLGATADPRATQIEGIVMV